MTEFQFIDFIRDACRQLPDNGMEGIGDDCAVLPIGDGQALVFTTDLLVEDIHFLRRAATPEEIGGKALSVNLSDVAAMGARPVATLLSVALPPEAMQEGWAEAFMQGYCRQSRRYGVLLAGGDTTASQHGITINVTAIGRASLDGLKRRRDARAGDVVLVAGKLGESAAGLRDILSGRYDTPLARIHKNPSPQVEEGCWFATRSEVHAMMDLSDGLASDLRHIMRQSAVGAEVDTHLVPAPAGLDAALGGGEDYKLLLTADPDACERLCTDFAARFGSPLYPVGRITEGPSEAIRWLDRGKPVDGSWRGFSHY